MSDRSVLPTSCLRIAVAVIASVLFMSTAARAEMIIPSTNLDDLIDDGSIGTLILGPESSDFITPPMGLGDIGDLINMVFVNEDGAAPVYTYLHMVIPTVSNVSEFNTGFDLRDLGFNGVAGYSFSDSDAVSGLGSEEDFLIVFNDTTDGTLDWEANLPLDEFFDSGETIRFFYQSTLPPGLALGDYNIINSEVGTAQSFLPTNAVPAPAALPMGLVGLAMMAGTKRKRKTA